LTTRLRAESSLASQVYAQLRADLLHARLRPGEDLSENQQAQRLGVSRTPVREAIQRLVSEGLVHVLPQRGTRVSLLSMARIREALFIREAVECQVVRRLLAHPRSQEDWRLLDACIAEQAQALRDGDLEATLAADARFHASLLELCGLGGVWPVVAQARDLHQRVRAIAVPELRSGRQAIADHRAIVKALRDGDADLAVGQVTRHLAHNIDLAGRIARLHPDYFEDDPDADRHL
jgi:DNA-binding GntR family transcriptional regulator